MGRPAAQVVQTSLARSLEDACLAASVARPLDTSWRVTFNSLIDIRKFHLDADLAGEVEFGASSSTRKGRIVASRVLRDAVTRSRLLATCGTVGPDRRFRKIAARLVAWTAHTVAELSQPKNVVPKKAIRRLIWLLARGQRFIG